MNDAIPQEFLDYIKYVNEEDYFEAHEVLEDLWHTDRIDFYKGMIQLAVAIFHLRHGNIAGARALFQRSKELLVPYRPVFRRIDVQTVTEYIDDCLTRIPDVKEMDRSEVEMLGIKGIRLQLLDETR